MKKEKAIYSTLNNINYVIKNIWQFDKILLFMLLIQSLTSVLIPFLGIYMPKLVIDELTNNSSNTYMILKIGGFTLLTSLAYFINNYVNNSRYIHSNTLKMNFIRIIMEKCMTCDYENIESARGQTKYQKALNSLITGDYSGISRIIPAMVNIISSVLGFLLYSKILYNLNLGIIILLMLTSTLDYLMLKYVRNYEHKNKDNWSSIDKKLTYIQNSSEDFLSAKDIRLYNMENWFLKSRDIFLFQRLNWIKKVENRKYFSYLLNALLIFLRDGLAYAYLIYAVVNNAVSISDFILYFGAITGFSTWFSNLINQFNELNSASLLICDTREFLDLPDKRDKIPNTPLPNINDYPLSIEFKNLSFKYPESENFILKNLNLKISKGEKIALVGANGEGKTTLVKLLCGFYHPTSGEILINNINTVNFKRDDLYNLFSSVFQDIFILPFTVAQNIALCNKEFINEEKVIECLKLAGLKERIEKLPDGIHSPMTKVKYDDGLILSGGEQQKLILARSLYKNAPIFLLDEPTAALDPIAESELYMKYNELTKNKTSLFISHRLASTRFCDKIAFLKDGKIQELGTHEELLKNGQEYAKIFEIQSHYYKDNLEELEEEKNYGKHS